MPFYARAGQPFIFGAVISKPDRNCRRPVAEPAVYDMLLLNWTGSVIIGAVNVLRRSSSRTALSSRILAGNGQLAAIAMNLISPIFPANGSNGFLDPLFVIHDRFFCLGGILRLTAFS